MNAQPQAPNPIIKNFGVAIGFALSLFLTAPIYHASHGIFHKFALVYIQWDYRWIAELVYALSIVALITLSGWFFLNLIWELVKLLVKTFHKLFGLLFVLLWR
ncbi:hypothetical protein [Paraglaciecola marina]|uniref:hypothetical protein n=1 Tax=Paraglaciecola marina TaxID=2500157 RepID=UPI0010619125|nr:hypothetical protein [Paraglaciecola marina]